MSKDRKSDKEKGSKAPKKATSHEPKNIETKAKPQSEASASRNSKVTTREETPKTSKRPELVTGTRFAKWGETTPQWRLVDATNLTLGRLSSQIAHILMGKDKPLYTRSSDTGDFVVVIHAEKVKLTGNKWKEKVYQYHTNFPGGLKTYSAEHVRETHPERVIRLAVYRMLPKGHMGRRWFSKLKVYAGGEHPHKAQNPKPMKFTNLGAMERVG